jgi:hypothetical protein
MSAEKFVLLTESDYNNYLKLKEQQTKYNLYHNNVNKSTYYNLKEQNPEQFKLLMQRQIEYNKKYRKNISNLKQSDPQKYENMQKLKIEKQTTRLLNKLKAIKKNQLLNLEIAQYETTLNESPEKFNNYIAAT